MDNPAAPFWLSYVPHHVAADLLAHPEASPLGREQRFSAVALFVDVSGFTAMSEALGKTGRAGTEELTTILNNYFAPMIDLIQSFGGIIAKFGGDAMTVLFPYVADTRATNIRRAAQCALDMQGLMTHYAAIPTSAGTFRLTMKAGLAEGRIFCTVVGDPAIRLEYIVAGSALDQCADAEHHAQPGQVITHNELLDGLGEVEAHAVGEVFTRIARLALPAAPAPLAPLPALSPAATAILERYLHPVIAERLRAGQASFVNEQRKVNILFISFANFDYDADPAVGAQLQTYFEKVIRLIHAYDGYLNKIDMGDKGSKYIVLFGAPVAHENDTERALRCALELRALPETRIRLGVTSGFVFCGLVGSSARQEYTVMGDDVNLAARLMAAAKPDEILAEAEAHQDAATPFVWSPGGLIAVKGKSVPIAVHYLTGLARRAALGLHEPKYALPMVGRQAELETVATRLDEALHGHGQIIGIAAEAGMGKSRLGAEVIRLAAGRGFAGFGGAGLSHGTTTGYLVWQDILRGLFDLDPALSDAEQLDRLAAQLAEADHAGESPSPLAPRMPLLGRALNLPVHDNELTESLDAKSRKESLEALLADYLRWRAKRTPLLLVFEDCHWIDRLSADLLEVVGRAVAHWPVALVLLYRPLEADQQWMVKAMQLPHATELRLTEFTAVEAERLITLKLHQLFGQQSQVPPALLERIAARAQGNPFYMDELISLIHDKGIQPEDVAALESLQLPDSLHSLIISRLDQLGEGPKTVIKAASVLGRVVRPAWLWGAYPELGSAENVKNHLTMLGRLDLVPQEKPEPELEYLFKHILTRDVAYESLTLATRTMLHEQIAGFIERTYGSEEGDDLSGYLTQLAYHYGLSRNTDKQREYFRRAGEAAQANYNNEAALEYFGKLRSLVDEREQSQIDLKLGQVFELTGRWTEAEASYRSALLLAEGQGEAVQQAQCQKAIGGLLRGRGNYPEALEWLGKAQHNFEQESFQTGVAQTFSELGNVHLRQGDPTAARNFYGESLWLFRALDDQRGIANVLNNLGLVAHDQGDYATARELYEECLDHYRELHDRRGIAICLGNLAQVTNNQGDYATARRLYEESLAVVRELGDKQRIVALLNNLGNLTNNQGDYAAATALHEESLTLKREMGDKRGIAASLGSLALVALNQGDYPHARHLHEESLALKREIGDKRGVSLSLNNLGLVVARQGDYAAARALYEESLTLKREIGDKRGIAASLNNLGEVAYLQDDHTGARQLYEESLAAYRELGDKRGIALSLNDLARVDVATHNIPVARAHLHESLTLRRDLGDKQGLAAGLVTRAAIASADGDHARAARLASAAQTLLETIGAAFDPLDRDASNRALVTAREQLSPEAFAAARTAGQGLTLDEAVAEALEG